MKDIVAVTGKYMKGNEEKAEFTKIGAIGFNNQSGKEFVLLDPSVSLSGVLTKQNALALERGEPQRASIMCSVFDKSQSQQQAPQQGGYQQQPQQMQQQTPSPEFDSDLPF